MYVALFEIIWRIIFFDYCIAPFSSMNKREERKRERKEKKRKKGIEDAIESLSIVNKRRLEDRVVFSILLDVVVERMHHLFFFFFFFLDIRCSPCPTYWDSRDRNDYPAIVDYTFSRPKKKKKRKKRNQSKQNGTRGRNSF